MNDLEQMKEQLALLRAKLDSQQIVNDRLLRQSMRQRMSWVKRYTIVSVFLLLPFVYIAYAGMTVQYGLPWGLYAYTCFMCTTCVLYDAYINNFFLSTHDFLNATLLELGRKLLRQKRLRFIGTAGGMTMLVPWFIWLCYAYHTRMPAGARMPMLIGAGVGLVIGIAIGLTILMRMQRTNDELIKEIEDVDGGN